MSGKDTHGKTAQLTKALPSRKLYIKASAIQIALREKSI
jgi:hypothetical protein